MEKVTIEPFNFIGISVNTTNENGQAAYDIAAIVLLSIPWGIMSISLT